MLGSASAAGTVGLAEHQRLKQGSFPLTQFPRRSRRYYEPRGLLAWPSAISAQPYTLPFPVATWDQARSPGLRRETCAACHP